MKIKNKKSLIYSSLALVCMILVFVIDWFFIIPAAILSYLGWKELLK